MAISAPVEKPTRLEALSENLKELHETGSIQSGAALGKATMELYYVAEYAIGIAVDGLKSLLARSSDVPTPGHDTHPV